VPAVDRCGSRRPQLPIEITVADGNVTDGRIVVARQ
jgi:hypothetical protein